MNKQTITWVHRACAAGMLAVLTFGAVAGESTATGGDAGLSLHEQDLMNVTSNREAVVLGIVESWRETMDALDWAQGWEEELTAALNSAPPEKVLAAMQAQSYEEVAGALSGRLTGPDTVSLEPGESVPLTLGSTDGDLVFTPLTPCRIIDTRLATGGFAGRIGPDAGKQFQVNLADFSAQGGFAGSCGIPTSLEVSAVAINITSTDQTGNGNLRVIQTGGGIPDVSLLNYQAGVNLANAAVVRSSTFVGDDIFVYSGVSATQVVVDLLGFFSAPEQTLPDQYVTSSGVVSIGTGTQTTYSPPCPAGYRLAGNASVISTWTADVTFIGARPSDGGIGDISGADVADRSVCQYRNDSGGNVNVACYATCLRIPGR